MKKQSNFTRIFTIGLLGLTLLTSHVEAGTLQTINQNNTSLVPLRIISEELGAKVDYNGANKEITVVYNGSVVVATIGHKSTVVNGKQQELQVAAQVIKGVTYVPIRFIGEALGGVVDYQKGSLKITIADLVKQWDLETTVHNPGSGGLNKKSLYLKKITDTKLKAKQINNDPKKVYAQIEYETSVLWDALLNEIEGAIQTNLTANEKKQYADQAKRWNDSVDKMLSEFDNDKYHHAHASDGDQTARVEERCRVLVNQYMK